MVSRTSELLARGYAACETTARAYDGPCPTRWRRLTTDSRRHVAAVYAYAHIAAGISARRAVPAVERAAQLEAWHRRLHAAVGVERSGGAPHAHEDVMVAALAHSIRSLDLPIACFDDLVSGFGQDITTTRYDSWADLLDYARRVANPLGRLVLRITGHRDEELDRSSDAMCTALLLTDCWWQVGADWTIGRLFIPRAVTAACRAREMDLGGPLFNDAWMAALGQCLDETRTQFEAARQLCDLASGPLRRERRLTWLRGMRLLERIERAGPALPSRPPRLGIGDAAVVRWRAARWNTSRLPIPPNALGA
jgi:phytoene/squalene synthetase